MEDEALNLLETIIKKIVDNPDAVKVTKTVDELGALYTCDMDPRDAGMVIGREGSTIYAIRGVIRVVAGKNKCVANVKLNVPDNPRRQDRSADRPAYRYQKQRKESFDDVDNQF
jgi:uncharacterized protein